jgi:hypothetical protein
VKPFLLSILALVVGASGAASAESPPYPLPDEIKAALDSSRVGPLQEALSDAGDNAGELLNALERLAGPLRDDAVFLILNMPHLDRLEMTTDVLLHHVLYADSSRRTFLWEVPDSLYREFILTYRLGDEPITDWRSEFWSKMKPRALKAESAREFALQVNRWAAENLTVVEKEFFGPQQSPDQTLATLRGTKAEIAALITALLKTVGIPCRQVTVSAMLGRQGGAQWSEIFCASCGKWLPLYPDHPESFGDYSFWEPESLRADVSYAYALSAFEMLDVTPRYTQTGWLSIRFTRGGEPAVSFDGFSVNVFQGGQFQPLDELGTAADSAGNYTCRLGEGSYWVVSGTRDASGSPFVQILPVVVSPGDTTRLDWDLTQGESDMARTADAKPLEPVPLFILNDATGSVRTSREAVGKSALLLVVLAPRHEPSIRMEEQIRSWLKKQKRNAPATLWVWQGEKRDDLPAEWTFDPSGYVAEHFGISAPEDFPLVVWINPQGYIRGVGKGYNLNIAALLSQWREPDQAAQPPNP